MLRKVLYEEIGKKIIMKKVIKKSDYKKGFQKKKHVCRINKFPAKQLI